MTATVLSFRQTFAAPTPSDFPTLLPRVITAAERAERCLRAQQRPDGSWPGPKPYQAAAQILGALDAETDAARRCWDWLWSRAILEADAAARPTEFDSLVVLDVLARSHRAQRADGSRVVADAVAALRDLQNSDGGWGMLDRYAPPADTAVPSCPDTTGRVLTILGRCGQTAGEPAIECAIDYLEREQEADSGWLGRAGASRYDGTRHVLAGLRAVGLDERFAAVRRAAGWLKRTQSLGGGWGDAADGSPGVDCTARALLGLLAAGEWHGSEVEAGVAWLLDRQKPDGAWDGALTAPLTALAEYRRVCSRHHAG